MNAACVVSTVPSQYVFRLYQICRLLGVSLTHPMSSMTSLLDSVADDGSTLDVRAGLQTSRVNPFKLARVQSDVTDVLDNHFIDIEKLLTSVNSRENIRTKLKQIRALATSDINDILNESFGAEKTIRRSADGYQLSTLPEKVGSEETQTSSSFSPIRVVQYQSNPSAHRAQLNGIKAETNEPENEALNTTDSTSVPDHCDVTAEEFTDSSTAVADELFGHIAKRLFDQGCRWEGLVDKLAASADCKKQIKADILAKQSGTKRASLENIYDVLSLWKVSHMTVFMLLDVHRSNDK